MYETAGDWESEGESFKSRVERTGDCGLPFMVGNHVTFCAYIQTEWLRKLIIISIILNKFSCGKVQILCRFSSKLFDKSRFYAHCIFPHKLEQRMKVFARVCV